jgi:very-short-patch-repair endonuclease
MTDAETRLWSKLRLNQLGCRFYRQRIIGDYIVDFFCPVANLVVEVDGGQHYSGSHIKSDTRRDAFLTSLGLKVLRFTDTDALNNTDGVIEKILEYIDGPHLENPP